MSRREAKPSPPRERHPDAIALYDPQALSVQQAAIATARAQGCTCAPKVTIAGASAVLTHDAWCALIRRKDVN